MPIKPVGQHPCLFDPWSPCKSVKDYRKLSNLVPPLCEHIRKATLNPGDVEFYVMMDSNCYHPAPLCPKSEGSQLRLIARWEAPVSRSNNKYKKLTYELKSLEGDALCFPGGDQDSGCGTLRAGTLYVFPDYHKVNQTRCVIKSVDVIKKSESALRRIPVAVKVRVWKDDVNVGGKQQDFILEVAVPPAGATLAHLPPVAPTSLEVFISYANEDSALKEQLVRYLKSLRDVGLVAYWHDREILAGTDWNREIDTHLNSAQIILLLVSLDFLASPYINSVELKRALERHDAGKARVIPIIIRHSNWEDTKIGTLQALPPGLTPISDYLDKDKWFTEVMKGLRSVIEELTQQGSVPPTEPGPPVLSSHSRQ